MAKDPAFLFYSKDWVDGTSEMMPDEKGVYIDLLVHQHQHGSIPSDIKRLCRIVRLSEVDFTSIWEIVCKKFIPNGNRMVNQKMVDVVTERLSKGHKNKIIGTFAGLIRTRKEPLNTKNAIKKEFNVNNFIEVPTELITERLTEWYEERLKSIVNANNIDNTLSGLNWGKESTDFLKDKTWVEQFCMQKGLQKKELEKSMKHFVTTMTLQEDWKTCVELKRHYTNYYNKHGLNGAIKSASDINELEANRVTDYFDK